MVSDRIVTAEMCRKAQERVDALGARPAMVRLSQAEPELISHVNEGMERIWAKLESYGFIKNGRMCNCIDETFYPTILSVIVGSLEALREGHRKLWADENK